MEVRGLSLGKLRSSESSGVDGIGGLGDETQLME